MNRTKLSLLLIVFMSMISTKLFAHDIEVKNDDGVTIYYLWNDNKTELIVSFRGEWYPEIYTDRYSGHITIPESVEYNGSTYTVTSIGKYAFYSCSSLTSVTIPNSVMSIGQFAFFACKDLSAVTIGNSVTSIGDDAFSECSSLTSITIPNSMTCIGDRAFRSCSSLTSITVSNGLASIGRYTFSFCTNLASIIIPNSVMTIGDAAFDKCSSITSITIPSSVTSIGYNIFSRCSSLTSIKVDEENTAYDSRNNCNAIIETANNTLISGCMNTVIPNSVTNIGKRAFSGCDKLNSVTIPSSVTSIGFDAFRDCNGLASVTIPSSVMSIESYAFSGCINLTSVTIPNNVTTIEYSTFRDCNSLTSVTIGNNVSKLDEYAFSGCDKLTSVTSLNSTPPSMVSNTFDNYAAMLQVPIGTKTKYQKTIYWRNFKNIVEIDPTGIQSITLDKDKKSPVYDLNGRRLESPQKGINIIGGKKVVVK